MRLPDGFLDELRARTPLSAIIGRRVKLTRSGRNWKGCCPFHNEKSPSFYVYEDGYHCFGCGAHGDAVGFVMQSQGLQFREAVDLLAGEAGLDVPKASPEAAVEEQRRISLQAVLEAAAELYQRRLASADGERARAYLEGRGLTQDTITRFGLGWSGEGRGQLAAALHAQGITPDLLVEAGLMRDSEDGRPPYDMFFNRVMFPIRDRQGRIASFGGRILGDGQPKYVNGPETRLFSKRRNLYGLDLARAESRRGAEIIAVEGYMDVIALHQAGFTSAVAPLGTALTEEQLAELWRLSPMPILCFDGDAAGQRAALRVADIALPHLTPDRSLRLARLPAGEDPDTLVRKHGPARFQAVLTAAEPISTALYGLYAAGLGHSPEQRAGLRSRLEAAAAKVADKPLASEIRRALLDQFFASRPQSPRPAFRPGARSTRPMLTPPLAITRTPPGPDLAASERARALFAILLRHPALLGQVEEALGLLDLPPPLAYLRDAILHWSSVAETLDSQALITHLHALGLTEDVTQVLSAVPMPLPECAKATASQAEAASGWWHFFGLMNPNRLEEEVTAARHAFEVTPNDAAQRRLIALCTASDALRRGRIGWDDQPDPA